MKFRFVEVPKVARATPSDAATIGTAFVWHGKAQDKASPIDPVELLRDSDVAEWLPSSGSRALP
ncbi:MAG: hypothetical protein H7A45_11860 [Verrucomicrobiales bacterium]|nr:hypothetical protein [Verrucomicrobiales bacterium]